MSILSVFSGIGGLDAGAALAGFNLGAQFDIDPTALAISKSVLKTNNYAVDLSAIDPEEVISLSGIQRGNDAILIGGPPCTGFSQAGFWIEEKRNGKDGQVNRLFDYLAILEALTPRFFVVENVPGLFFKTHRKVLNRFVNKATRLGYSISFKVINAADYGVPQARRRAFIVGIKGKKRFEFGPAPYVASPRTARWAFSDLINEINPPEKMERLRGKYAELLPLVPPGDNYLFFTKPRGFKKPIFRWRGRYFTFLQKLNPDQPAPTIPATRVTYNGPFHWRNRHLRIREIARLQGFPDDYPTDDDQTAARRHLGNAVPPLVSAEIFWEIRHFLGEAEKKPDLLQELQKPETTAKDVSRKIFAKLRKL